MQYFVRIMDARKDSRQRSLPIVKVPYPELACSTLSHTIEQAKRSVLESDKSTLLQADACFRNLNQVRSKYRC